MGKHYLIARDIFQRAARCLFQEDRKELHPVAVGAFCYMALQEMAAIQQEGKRIEAANLIEENEALTDILKEGGTTLEAALPSITATLHLFVDLHETNPGFKHNVAELATITGSGAELDFTPVQRDALAALVKAAAAPDHPDEQRELLIRKAVLILINQEEDKKAGITVEPSASESGAESKAEGVAPRDPFFTGREDILNQLHKILSAKGFAVLSQPASFSCLGGIGKSATAFEYMHRHGHEYDYVLWLQAEREADLYNGFSDMAEAIELPDREEMDPAVKADRVLNWIEDHPGGLLIYDHVNRSEQLESFLPEDETSHILLVSSACYSEEQEFEDVILLPPLTEEESLAFLTKRSGLIITEEEDRQVMISLARELAGIPLALELAAAEIALCGSPGAYLEKFRSCRLKPMRTKRLIAGLYPRAVARAWVISLEGLKQESPASLELLQASAFMNPDEIWLETIIAQANQLVPPLREGIKQIQDVERLLEPLVKRALVHRDPGANHYRMHRMLQGLVKDDRDS